jgi:hypothetical protein
MTREEIAENYPELLCLDPKHFDEAIVGVIHDFDRTAVCYSEAKVIEILMKEDGMEYLDAIEYYQFNILGAWLGENTPMYLEVL